jgi:hypothetical protein
MCVELVAHASVKSTEFLTVADGLYQVITSYFCAGFVVENGAVTRCAPILRHRIDYWKTIAAKIQ